VESAKPVYSLNRNDITEAETRELDSYLHIGFLLGVMQAKARRLLDTEPALARQ
jgi:hypothetical protein